MRCWPEVVLTIVLAFLRNKIHLGLGGAARTKRINNTDSASSIITSLPTGLWLYAVVLRLYRITQHNKIKHVAMSVFRLLGSMIIVRPTRKSNKSRSELPERNQWCVGVVFWRSSERIRTVITIPKWCC